MSNGKIMDLVVLAIYLTAWTVLAATSVGEIPKCDGQPTAWYLPLQILFAFGFPTWLGYLIGKNK